VLSEHHTDNIIAIHFGIEQVKELGQLSNVTTSFIRLLYKSPSKEATGLNIEDSIRTDWFINNCSEAYEYIGSRNEYHLIKQIRHKSSVGKRKPVLYVA
jgi:hypothetical protein